MDELFPLIETLQLLGFANVSAGDIELTALGRAYAEADMLARKQLFAEAVLKHIPLAAHIRRVLDERPGHRAPAARFLRELEDHLSGIRGATGARHRHQLGPARGDLLLRS